MAMPQVDGWIPCTPLHPPLLSLSTLLPCGPWRHDVPFMVECPSVTCSQHCDQVCLHSFLIKEECGDLLSGWSHINKRNYIVLLIVQHSQDGSVDNVNINRYIFMKYQDVWFRCTLHDAQSCLQSFLDWKHRGSYFQILFWRVARAVWNELLSAVTSPHSSSRTSCYCVKWLSTASPVHIPFRLSQLPFCSALLWDQRYLDSKWVRRSHALCLSVPGVFHLLHTVISSYSYGTNITISSFFTDEWHLSVCVHGIFVSIGVGESNWVSLPFSASVSSAALRMEV